MPAELQKGKATIWGITNDGTPIALTGVASTFILDTAKASHKFEVTKIKDESESTTSLIAVEETQEVDLNWTPSGATRAAAAATAAFITPLATVTLSDFKVSQFNGTYNYMGGESIDLSKKEAKMTIKLERWIDSTQNTLLTGAVING